MLAFWNSLSPWHLLLLAAVALLFYGNRLPEVARSLGRAVNEFKRGLKDVQDEIVKEDPAEGAGPPQQKLEAPQEEARLESGKEGESVTTDTPERAEQTSETKEV